jgi:hypothetical protein
MILNIVPVPPLDDHSFLSHGQIGGEGRYAQLGKMWSNLNRFMLSCIDMIFDFLDYILIYSW